MNQPPMACGIYLITHGATGDTYVGSAVAILTRWRVHLCHLRTNAHHNKGMQKLADDHGLDLLAIRVLELCERSVRLQRENAWITELKPTLNRIRPGNRELTDAVFPQDCRKRYPIEMEPDTLLILKHLAVDLDETVEHLAARLFAQGVRRMSAESRKH